MKHLVLTGIACLLSQSAFAQRDTLVLRDGFSIAGVGTVTSIGGIAGVDEEGRFLAWIDTDQPDGARDGLLFSEVGITLREGDAFTTPIGTSFDAVDGFSLTGSDGYFATVSLNGTTNSSDDEALILNGQLVFREGDNTTASGFSAGTVWRQLFEVWSVSADQALVAANVDDPNLPTSTDRALVRLNFDPAGQILSATVIAAEGSLLGIGLPPLADVGVSPQSASMNLAGDVLYQARFDGAAADVDGALFLGPNLVAREGSSSPIPNRTWEILAERPVDLNDSGSWVLRGNLDGDVANDEVIVLNPANAAPPRIVAREGDTLIPFNGSVLESFGLNSPVFVSAEDAVLWYGDWSDADETRDSGLIFTQLDHPNPDFVHQVLIREGVTRFEGLLVDTIAAEPGGYAMSRDGRFVLCKVRFVGGVDGLVLLDRLGPHPSFCSGDVPAGSLCEPCPCGNQVPIGVQSGCRHSAGVGAELVTEGNARVSADSLRFEVRNGVPSSFALLLSGADRLPASPTHPCLGLDTGVYPGNLDGLLCVGGGVRLHGARRSDSLGEVGQTTPGFGPPDRPLQGLALQGGFMTGQARHFQVWMRESVQVGCQTGLVSTNGRTVVWQL